MNAKQHSTHFLSCLVISQPWHWDAYFFLTAPGGVVSSVPSTNGGGLRLGLAPFLYVFFRLRKLRARWVLKRTSREGFPSYHPSCCDHFERGFPNHWKACPCFKEFETPKDDPGIIYAQESWVVISYKPHIVGEVLVIVPLLSLWIQPYLLRQWGLILGVEYLPSKDLDP